MTAGKSIFPLLFAACLLAFSTARAEGLLPVTGRVLDAQSGDPLIGATVWAPATATGTITDENGRFELPWQPDGPMQVVFSYIGYHADTLQVGAPGPLAQAVALTSGVQLEEVVVTDAKSRLRANVERTRMGYVDLSMDQVNRLPALLSENDALKAIQLLPGIQSAEGATTGFFVRGGSGDQNLINLNDAVIYNPFHAAGFISIFNGDFIKDLSVEKSAFPATHGGRLSSHLQVNTREPSMEKVTGTAGLGLVTARLTLDAPLVRDKLAVTVSARGFYSYALARAFIDDEIKRDLPEYYFYDAFGQLVWKPTAKDKIHLYGYQGKDLVAFQDKSSDDSTAFRIPWSNTAVGGSYTRTLNDRVVLKWPAWHSRYDFAFTADYSNGDQRLSTELREWGTRPHADHAVGRHFMSYGVEAVYRNIRPHVSKSKAPNSSAPNTRIADVAAVYRHAEVTPFFNDDWKPSPRLGIRYGLRLPLYAGNGAFYWSVNPSVVVRYQVLESASVKASYSYGSQFIHMLVSSTATTPLDLWVGSDGRIGPQSGHAVALGWFQNLAGNALEASVEGYYRKLSGQLEYREGADVFSNEAIADKVLAGEGWSGGMEFLLRKREGDFTGFVGYTLAWARRQFDGLNGGDPFDYKYDRRHDLTVSLSYRFARRWTASALFVIGSAQALTVPQGVSYTPTAQGWAALAYDYGQRNSFRLRPYHRLDLSLKYSGKPRRVQSHFKLDIYNVYNRKNSFFVLLDAKGWGTGTPDLYLRDYALIPVVPSISYQMDF